MTLDLTKVLIFKTNIGTEKDKEAARALLEPLALIEEWSVDLEDVDCVLRIVSQHLSPEEIITLIKNGGFDCCELE